jgi:prepilin-type N-terminal cleavage/methylation domain-containing protein
MKLNKKAFTLVELLIVITIISILFVVLITNMDFATDKAKTVGVQTDFHAFHLAIESVANEYNGFNTLGWNTGDTNGNGIRDSFDTGDMNRNGIMDDDEEWTDNYFYAETWNKAHTLINPANPTDIALSKLEAAINDNLEPKLRIRIADDGTITMANGAQDPCKTEYHGRYITNASADAAAKWNTDASMVGSTGDSMDNGAILMYSNGANKNFGTKVKVVNGKVTAVASLTDADHPDGNVAGSDDYVLSIVYSYANGYGQTGTETYGFAANQIFYTGNNNVPSVNVPENNEDTETTLKEYQMLSGDKILGIDDEVFISEGPLNKFLAIAINGNIINNTYFELQDAETVIFTLSDIYINSLDPNNTYELTVFFTDGNSKCNVSIYTRPTIEQKENLNDYTWLEIQSIYQEGLSVVELESKYNITLGSYKIYNGKKFWLVDVDGNDYNGFVFMYDTEDAQPMDVDNSNKGGYKDANLSSYVEAKYYTDMDENMRRVIKKVSVIYNDGNYNHTKLYNYDYHIFLPAAYEVGLALSGYQYSGEGYIFDFFWESSNMQRFNENKVSWWLRTAGSFGDQYFENVLDDGTACFAQAQSSHTIFAAFVVG